MQYPEKLGVFYLGREYDIQKRSVTERPVMYDARDLTTHAVCVGMTGSGKTGLCIGLLEEAALDKVPAIIIDPKGDITNMLLTFPELLPEQFEPWINVDDARRKNMTVKDYAASTAETWKKGIESWGQSPERITSLKESAEFRILTPGSDAGIPVSILSSLDAPKLDWSREQELLRERIQGTVSALLGLAGIEADPLKSREHILLSSIMEHEWRNGRDLSLEGLIRTVQNPPMKTVGVFDVDTFFPEKDRFGLAMAFNNILAAPGFASWLQGESMDVESMLHAPDGSPRHSIFYIAHLSDAERMFFVTLLLEQIVTWMRRQSGTTSLRALLYFDEVFGFFPPVAEPPSKRPLLTVLKQARAFGLGAMLTTQNPVDIDYKGLTNAGTWFIGRLQTDRDKQRVLDGLETVAKGSGATLQRGDLDSLISGLSSRVFLLHNVHEKEPLVFNTRWVMSYLRGPLTRPQVRTLMEDYGETIDPLPGAEAPALNVTESAYTRRDVVEEEPRDHASSPPVMPPGMEAIYFPVELSRSQATKHLGTDEIDLRYEPVLAGFGRVRFYNSTRKIDHVRNIGLMLSRDELEGLLRWNEAVEPGLGPDDLRRDPEEDVRFPRTLPQGCNSEMIKDAKKALEEHLYGEMRLEILYCPALRLYGMAEETERDFKSRAFQIARERRDEEVDTLRDRMERAVDRIENKINREQRELNEDVASYEARKREEIISAGETIVGLLGIFGRKRSTGLSTAARKRRMTSTALSDVRESEAEIERLEEELEELKEEMEEKVGDISIRWESVVDEVETYAVKPRRTDVQIDLVTLAWAPYWVTAGRWNNVIPAWEDK